MKDAEKEHRKRHRELHRGLDELVADWVSQTGSLPSRNTVYELMQWSNEQTLEGVISDS